MAEIKVCQNSLHQPSLILPILISYREQLERYPFVEEAEGLSNESKKRRD
jgi:hypothetical protein